MNTYIPSTHTTKFKSRYDLLTSESIESTQNRSGGSLFPSVNTSFACFAEDVVGCEVCLFIEQICEDEVGVLTKAP